METRKGLFTPEQQKKLAKKADQRHKAKGLKEALDGPAFLLAIWALDDLVFDKLPNIIKRVLTPFIDKIIDNL